MANLIVEDAELGGEGQTEVIEPENVPINKMQLRQVTALLKDIQIIEMDCIGARARGVYGDDSKLDEFQRYKLDLNEMLVKIKGDIKTQKGLENRVGTSTESIKLKRRIKNNLKKLRDYVRN